MASTRFTDLLIHIFPGSDPPNFHRADATISDGSFFHGHFALDPEALLQKQLDPGVYGRTLCESLFIGPIGQAHERAMSLAQSQSGGRLRVRLWIDEEAPRLQVLPWERLYHYHTETMWPLSLAEYTPFSRYIGVGRPEPNPLATSQVHILVAMSNPSNLTEYRLSGIDVEQEVMALHEALSSLPQVSVTIMPGCTGLPAEVGERLGPRFRVEPGPTNLERIKSLWTATDETYQVLHFLGHGTFKSKEGAACLYLEKDNGTVQVVEDKNMVQALRLLRPRPALVFLAACESSTSDPEHSFTGLGPRLVHDADIPAVVAMQGKVEMELAKRLTGRFYCQLVRHGMVDLALNEARSYVFDSEEIAGRWDIPVLFTRLETGQLFAADPIREALEAMACDPMFSFFGSADYVPLPIQVIHLTANQQAHCPPWSEPEATTAVSLLSAVKEILSRQPGTDSGRQRLVALLGGHGTNKSTQLKHIVWRTIQRSREDREPHVLPVYVNLQGYEPMAPTPLETLILECLGRYWPDLKARRLSELESTLVLRIVFDRSESLPEEVRDQAWERIADLIATDENRRHQYMLSGDPETFGLDRFRDAGCDVHRLLIQPLSQQKIRHFLSQPRGEATDGQAESELLKSLNQSQLFDLVSVPALLAKAVQRARRGDYPMSRVDFLQRWVKDSVLWIPAEQGMRFHTLKVLSRLAWQMQFSAAMIWPVSQAFQIMAEVRGDREYSREAFLDELVKAGLLARMGDASLRFAYRPLQAYCCALSIMGMPDRDRVLRDITATFDRLERMHWWEDMLVYLIGLLEHDPEALCELLSRIVFGANLLEEEHVFLAARCLLECEQCPHKPDGRGKSHAGQLEAISHMRDQVCMALRWRCDSANEPDLRYRILAIRTLGQLADPAMALELGGIAYEKVRKNLRGESDYDFSSVRMAAAIALQKIDIETAHEELNRIDPPLIELYDQWQYQDMAAISSLLSCQDTNLGIRSLAALALGDLLSRAEEVGIADGTVTIKPADQTYLAHLENALLDPHTSAPVRWAVTHALAMVDVPIVTNELFDRIRRAVADLDCDSGRIELYKCLAYLIGRTRSPISKAHVFLVKDCFQPPPDARLWACAIEALSWLSDRSDKACLEEIAANSFERRPLNEYLPDEKERDFVRLKAIEALRNIGDMDTLRRLQAKRHEEWLNDVHWSTQLTQAFYRTCHEIYERLDQEAKGGRLTQ